jgi:hypothetical protein
MSEVVLQISDGVQNLLSELSGGLAEEVVRLVIALGQISRQGVVAEVAGNVDVVFGVVASPLEVFEAG